MKETLQNHKSENEKILNKKDDEIEKLKRDIDDLKMSGNISSSQILERERLIAQLETNNNELAVI